MGALSKELTRPLEPDERELIELMRCLEARDRRAVTRLLQSLAGGRAPTVH